MSSYLIGNHQVESVKIFSKLRWWPNNWFRMN